MMKLDIIIPVYNEDENIVRLLKALEDEVVCNFRVLICYDSESDKTLKYLKNSNAINKEILLIKNPRCNDEIVSTDEVNTESSKAISNPRLIRDCSKSSSGT